MDPIVSNLNTVSLDFDILVDELHGIAWQKDMDVSVPYDQAYFEKYVKYEGTPIAKAINHGRFDLSTRFQNGVVLDIGIGSGEFIKYFKENSTKSIYGYDINEHAIVWLKKQGIFVDPYVSIPEDIGILSFWDSLEHVPNPGALLSKIRSQMVIAVSIPIFEDIWRLKQSKHYRPNEHYWYFTDAGLHYYMGLHGFTFLHRDDFETAAGREDIASYAFIKQ